MPELRSLLAEPTALSTGPSSCSSAGESFCDESSVNAERAREKDSLGFRMLSPFLHVLLASAAAVLLPCTDMAHSSANSPIREVGAETLSYMATR